MKGAGPGRAACVLCGPLLWLSAMEQRSLALGYCEGCSLVDSYGAAACGWPALAPAQMGCAPHTHYSTALRRYWETYARSEIRALRKQLEAQQQEQQRQQGGGAGI